MSVNELQDGVVWRGAEMHGHSRWIKQFPSELLGAIDIAVQRVEHIRWEDVNKENFPLPRSEVFFDDVRKELENGSGMVKMRGLDVSAFNETQLQKIWYALGKHLGTPMYQNRHGELMRLIRDEGKGAGAKKYGETVDASGNKFLSSGARTLSPGELRFHTDRCDVVGLLCVRQASAGGVSTLCNSVAVYNEILRRRPDLHALLCQPIPRGRFGEEAGGEHIAYDLPVFGVRDNKFTSHFSYTYIESAQQIPSVRRLDPKEWEALQFLLEVSQELCFEMTLEPGDIQLLNNHVIYHGRTAFVDDVSMGQDRMLMRLWLSLPNSRALPADQAVLWGDVEAGQPRGGIAQSAAPV